MVQRVNSFVVACKDFEQDLVLYYYGELSGADRSKIEAHSESCERCRLYLKELASILPRTVEPDEPPQTFWDNYSREMRHKLAAIQERKSWWETVASLFRPWQVSALAATMVVVLALTLTFGNRIWRTEPPPDEETLVEVLPMVRNLEFFTTMEVLDAMDFLEYWGGQANGTA
ncbi:MAG TPA: zf-HC2 domain-containing protein [Candidatus Binatia bacterium]|nr:zf-HC2 domain-containing protein [Candidatus Binatia bacterium]